MRVTLSYLTPFEQLVTQLMCAWFYKYGTSRVQTKVRLPVNPREMRVLMLGLDGAGKTTALYKLKLDEIITTIPTIGFNVETINYTRFDLTIWDVGGDERLRVLWRHYLQNTHSLIYFVDASDRERIEKSREELHRLLAEEELSNAVLLVFANKQDLPGALTCQDIATSLGLKTIRHQWSI